MLSYDQLINVRINVPSLNSSSTSSELQSNDLPLKDNHVDIYLIQPQLVNGALRKTLSEIVTSAEQEKINKKRTDTAQRDALLTRVLIRTVLSRYAALSPLQWIFDKGWNGKPFISDTCRSKTFDIEFNLSHAKDLIACAVTKNTPLGIDVEYTKRKSDTYKLAPRYFSDYEVNNLEALPYEEQRVAFYNYWTLKESYIKACGDGLSIPLNHFSFDISEPNNIKLSFDQARNDNPVNWKSLLFNVTNDHKMALTVKTQEKAITTTIYLMDEHGKFQPASLPIEN